MSCNFRRLEELCRAKGHEDAIKYVRSLIWKVWLARYHRDEAAAKAQPLVNQPADLTNPQNDPKWILAQYEVEAHTVAVSQALHSIADVSAQTVNVCFNLGKTEKQVTAYRIRDELSGQPDYADIHAALSALLDCDSFKYVEAFVNTVKHRRLIDISFNININAEAGQIAEGVRFQQFDFDRSGSTVTYPSTFANEICDRHSVEIVRMTCDLIDKLIAFLERT